MIHQIIIKTDTNYISLNRVIDESSYHLSSRVLACIVVINRGPTTSLCPGAPEEVNLAMQWAESWELRALLPLDGANIRDKQFLLTKVRNLITISLGVIQVYWSWRIPWAG